MLPEVRYVDYDISIDRDIDYIGLVLKENNIHMSDWDIIRAWLCGGDGIWEDPREYPYQDIINEIRAFTFEEPDDDDMFEELESIMNSYVPKDNKSVEGEDKDDWPNDYGA